MSLPTGKICSVVFVGDNNPVLRQKAQEVTVDDNIKELMGNMIATMHERKGTGIAAPQIGVSKRVIVYLVSEERAKREGAEPVPIIGLANPYFEKITDETEEGWEGCLSVPGNNNKCIIKYHGG